MKKIEWQSVGGINYKLEISDGSNSVTTLTGSDRPFVLSIDQDDDLFLPIREQSGNIEIVADSVGIDDVIGTNPFSRPVSLYSNSVLIWKGYLQGQAFTQTWDKGPNTISLPVTSPLSTLRSLYPSNNVDDLVYISFADFLCQLKVSNVNIYGRYIFPASIFANDSFTDDASGKNPLRMKFNLLNYATWNADTKQYDVQSYYDILSDIARLFGFQIIEKGMALCFLFADQQTNYISVVYENMNALTNNPSQQVTTIDTSSVVTHNVWGNDHSMTFIPGKKKVRSVDSINDLDDTIYSLDIQSETFGQKQSHSVVEADGNRMYLSRSFITDSGSVIYPRDSNVNFKFDDFYNETNTGKGCCIVRERTYKYNNRTGGGGSISEDTGWVCRILFRIKDLTSGTRMFTITSPNRLFYNGLTSHCYLSVKGSVKYAESSNGEWKNFTGNLPITIKVGSTSGTTYIGVQDGKIIGGRSNTYVGNQADGYNIPIIQDNGHITFEMLIPNDYTLDNYGINKNYYYSIEDLAITYNSRWDYIDAGQTVNPYKSDYRKEYTTNIGFDEEYEMESSLFVAHSPLPLGKGLILANGEQYSTTSLYGTNPPEEELAARLYAYYQQTRKKLEVVMQCTGDLYEPWMRHKPVTPSLTLPGMACLSQQIDFANDEIRADLFDVS